MQDRLETSLQWLLAILASLALLFCAFPNRIAQSHEVQGFHNEHHHNQLHGWYSKLMRPDNPTVSCCSSHDCTPTQARLVNGQWQALKAGRWISIPETKINREESTDTAAHICWAPYTQADDSVLCFIKPGDGI